jgi:hypothetical protein
MPLIIDPVRQFPYLATIRGPNMKKITILAILLFVAINCFSQRAIRTCCSCYNFFSDEEVLFIRDSTILYRFDEGSDSWVETGFNAYHYDDRFKLKKHMIYIVHPEEFTRTRLNRYIYEYSLQDRTMIRYGFRWEEDWNNWVKTTQAKYIYDSSLVLAERLDLNWNDTKQDWFFNYDNKYIYESEDADYKSRRNKWNSGLKTWMNDAKAECEIDDNNRKKVCTTYHWDEKEGAWIPYQFSSNIYDAAGALQMRTLNFWDSETGAWGPHRNFYYIYDSFGREIEWLSFRVDESGNRIGAGRQLYTYDSDGNRNETLRYGWDYQRNSWTLYGKQVEYWTSLLKSSKENLDKRDIKIYPNPFEEKATIELGDFENIARIEMIDMFGRTVRIFSEINQPTITLDRINLQSGLYLLQVYTHSGTETIRVIIE